MARNLDKLSKDELYLLLAEEVDQEAANAIKNEAVSGGSLVDLTDSELRTLLPKLGPRRMVKMLDDNFQRDSPSQPKVKPSHCIYRHKHELFTISYTLSSTMMPHNDETNSQ